MLELVIKKTEFAAYKSLYSQKLDNPLLEFHDKMKEKGSGRSGILSLEGNLSVDSVENFFGAYGVVRDRLLKNSSSAIGSYRNVADLYAMYVGASYAHEKLSKHVEGEKPYSVLFSLQGGDDEYLMINYLASNYLNGTNICRTGKELAQLTKGFFSRIKYLAEKSLMSKEYIESFNHIKNQVKISFEEDCEFSGLDSSKAAEKKNIPNENVTLDDIGGNNEAKEIVATLISSLKNPETETYGWEPPRGILFYGPPGTGKTLTAKAVACGCSMPFYYFNIAENLSKWVGESENAFQTQLSREGIHFIDEADSVLGITTTDNPVERRLKNIIAELMSGYNSKKGSIYIFASNVLELEKKFKRAGRIDYLVRFNYPDRKDIGEILGILLKKKQARAKVPIFNGIDVRKVADMIYAKSMYEHSRNPALGIVGADIAEIIRRVHDDKWRSFLKTRHFDRISTTDFFDVVQKYELEDRA